MLLTVDIGNSNICLSVFEDNKIKYRWRLKTVLQKDVENYAVDIIEAMVNDGFDGGLISGVIIASVVPSLTEVLKGAIGKLSKAKITIAGLKGANFELKIKLKNKKEVGQDRLVTAVAGFKKHGGNLIIIDFGTATTFDVIGKNGEYLGGVIAPGINLSAKALFEMTAQLPQIELKTQKNVIGKNTLQAMNSGLYFGYISLCEGLIARIKEEYKEICSDEMTIIATGGHGEMFYNALKQINYLEPDLTCEGLNFIYRANN